MAKKKTKGPHASLGAFLGGYHLPTVDGHVHHVDALRFASVPDPNGIDRQDVVMEIWCEAHRAIHAFWFTLEEAEMHFQPQVAEAISIAKAQENLGPTT